MNINPGLKNSWLAAAVDAAKAGAEQLERWRSKFQVKEKARADLVTDADQASQDVIKQLLLRRFPETVFLGEEDNVGKSPQDVRPALGAPPTWVVDPLDGTANYVHDIPAYCVSIGLVVENTPVVGVVFDPRQNELFTASLGGGAFLNGKVIHVSPTATVRDSLLSTGFPSNYQKQQINLKAWVALSEHAQGLRRTGSSALNMAYVAAGRFDGYWAYDNYPWDIAAGAVLITEAGGRLDTAYGEDFDVFRPDLVCTNGRIQKELLALLPENAGRR